MSERFTYGRKDTDVWGTPEYAVFYYNSGQHKRHRFWRKVIDWIRRNTK